MNPVKNTITPLKEFSKAEPRLRLNYEPVDEKICSAADAPLGKPAPDVYLHACNELRLRPEMCLAVEDAPNGIRSAYDAGCKVVFVPDQTSEEPEAEALCIATCRDLHTMIKLLEGEPDFTGGIRYHNS